VTSPFTRLRMGWLWLAAGQPAVARALRGEDTPAPARWPGNAATGKKLLKRRFLFAGCDVEMAGRIAWQVESANEAWQQALYGFRWMEDVAATGNVRIASSFCREFVNSFIVDQDELAPVAWAPDVTGIRLAEWLHHRVFLLKSGSQRFQRRFVRALIAHVWRLQRMGRDAVPGEMLLIVKGLLAASVHLPMLRLPRQPLYDALDALLDEIVLDDGVHASRCPEIHLHVLQHLIEMRDLLLEVGEEHVGLEKALLGMGSALRFFCHGDGRLALFNGSLMEEPQLIAQVIGRSDNGEPVPAHMDASGFFRLERGHACLLLCGQPQRPLAVQTASLGSFEFSDGPERFVINCGGYRGTSPIWQNASLSPAAHSTLSLEAVHGAERRNFALSGDEVLMLKADTFQNDGAQLTARTMHTLRTGENEGVHERELRLNAGGLQFSGIDSFRLLRTAPDAALQLNLRFHLHPDIRCQRQKDGTISLSSVGGSVWYFTSTMPKATQIEESVYLGYYGKPQKTLQIVISTEVTTKLTEFRWSLTRQAETL